MEDTGWGGAGDSNLPIIFPGKSLTLSVFCLPVAGTLGKPALDLSNKLSLGLRLASTATNQGRPPSAVASASEGNSET